MSFFTSQAFHQMVIISDYLPDKNGRIVNPWDEWSSPYKIQLFQRQHNMIHSDISKNFIFVYKGKVIPLVGLWLMLPEDIWQILK